MEAEAGVTEIDTSVGEAPVPVSETLCGVRGALSVNCTAPFRVPVTVGVKVTETMQVAPTAMLVGQLLVCAKSPLATIPVILSTAEPLLVTVIVLAALVVLVVWLGKVRLDGLNEIPATPMPVPVSA